MAQLAELEPHDIPLEQRLEARINTIVTAGRDHSLDAASALLEALQQHDPEDIRDRLMFLQYAIDIARTGDERILADLPDRERDAIRQIASVLTEGKNPADPETKI